MPGGPETRSHEPDASAPERSGPLVRPLLSKSARIALLPLALLIVGIAVGALTPTLRAQEPEVIRLPQPGKEAPPPPSVKGAHPVPMNVQEVLGELWFRRKGYLEKGDQAAAEKQVLLMRDVIRREGVLNADDIAGAFLVDGVRLLEAGNVPRAIQSIHLACEFAPDRPDTLFAVCRALWVGEHDFWGAATNAAQAVQTLFRNPASRSAYLGSLALVFLAGTLFTAMFWCLSAALRTVRLAHHDFYESRLRSLSERPARTVAWILWLLPALLWLTGWWVLVYWLVLGTAYMRRSERFVSIAACLCFLSVLPTLGWITRESALTTDPAGRFLLELARGGNNPERIPPLERMAAAHPGEPLY